MPEGFEPIVRVDHQLPEPGLDVRRRQLTAGSFVIICMQLKVRMLIEDVNAHGELAHDLMYLAIVQVRNVLIVGYEQMYVIVVERHHLTNQAVRMLDGYFKVVQGEQPMGAHLCQQLLRFESLKAFDEADYIANRRLIGQLTQLLVLLLILLLILLV